MKTPFRWIEDNPKLSELRKNPAKKNSGDVWIINIPIELSVLSLRMFHLCSYANTKCFNDFCGLSGVIAIFLVRYSICLNFPISGI